MLLIITRHTSYEKWSLNALKLIPQGGLLIWLWLIVWMFSIFKKISFLTRILLNERKMGENSNHSFVTYEKGENLWGNISIPLQILKKQKFSTIYPVFIQQFPLTFKNSSNFPFLNNFPLTWIHHQNCPKPTRFS